MYSKYEKFSDDSVNGDNIMMVIMFLHCNGEFQILTPRTANHAQKEAHRGKASQMSVLQQGVHQTRSHAPTREHPHGHQTLQVPLL